MNNLRYLQPIDETRRQHLLRELYQLAKTNKHMEQQAAIIRRSTSAFRKTKNRFLSASRLVAHALQDVKKARRVPGCIAGICEMDSNLEKRGITFGSLEESLVTILNSLQAFTRLHEELIHPKMRTVAERRAAKDTKKRDDAAIPLSEKTKAIDQWFIVRAAAYLKEYKPTGNKKLRRYDTVIAKVVNAAYGVTWSEESIRKALNRQKGKPIPQYVLDARLSPRR
jgi:hypothetical protein